MGFEPMISGMKILRPRPTRRTEQRCCLKYLVYKTIFFLLLLGLQPNPQILQNVAILKRVITL